MTRAGYTSATEIAEQLIAEKAQHGHHDEAYGAYVLWLRLTGRFHLLKDSQRLFALSQKGRINQLSYVEAGDPSSPTGATRLSTALRCTRIDPTRSGTSIDEALIGGDAPL